MRKHALVTKKKKTTDDKVVLEDHKTKWQCQYTGGVACHYLQANQLLDI